MSPAISGTRAPVLACALLFGLLHSTVWALAPRPSLGALFSPDFEPQILAPVTWADDGASYTILEQSSSNANAKEIVRYEAASGRREVLVSANDLIPKGADRPLLIDAYQWSRDRRRVLINTGSQKVWRQKTRGDYWVLDRDTKQLYKLGGRSAPAALMFASFSPDGYQVAYLRRDFGPLQMATNLYVEEWATGHILALTSDAETRNPVGGGHLVINGTADWVNEEEFDVRKGYEWSPDGSHIAYLQFDATAETDFSLINNTDSLYPVVSSFPYPHPGTANASTRVGIVASSGGGTQWLNVLPDPANGYIPRLAWSPDSNELFLQRFDRLQQNLELVSFAMASGRLRVILHEHSDTWVDVVNDFRWFDGGRQFLWMSERDGWRHAYAVPRAGGRPRLITQGNFDVTGIAGLDEEAGVLYYLASPHDATRRMLYHVGLRGRHTGAQVAPADKRGTHQYDMSPNGRWAIHTTSSFDVPPSTELVRLPDHRSIRQLLDNSDLPVRLGSLLANPVEFFRIEIPGGYSLDGLMLKPSNFDPSKKYPVVVHVYGETGAQLVLDRWGDRRVMFDRHMAQTGYVVLSFDNRGTPSPKGYAWRHAVYGSLGDLAAQEQAAAIRALAAQRSYLDLNRVGVWGWSGGGSMTLHMIFRYPEIYKLAMSIASVPDQRYYDTIYQERYMGMPRDNPAGYARGSPINYADGLSGNLLIVSGSGDDNCHFQMSEMLLNRLISLHKTFDFMEYPNRSHIIDEGAGTVAHLYATLDRYVRAHLPVEMPSNE